MTWKSQNNKFREKSKRKPSTYISGRASHRIRATGNHHFLFNNDSAFKRTRLRIGRSWETERIGSWAWRKAKISRRAVSPSALTTLPFRTFCRVKFQENRIVLLLHFRLVRCGFVLSNNDLWYFNDSAKRCDFHSTPTSKFLLVSPYTCPWCFLWSFFA